MIRINPLRHCSLTSCSHRDRRVEAQAWPPVQTSALAVMALAIGCCFFDGASAARALQPAAASAGDATPIISREVLFGNPQRASVQLSGDGEWLSWLAPVDDVLNVWIAPASVPTEARPITEDDDRGIRMYMWMPDNRHIVYLQDRDGDENWRVYSVNIETGEEIDLTPLEGVAARITHVSRDFPGELLIGINDRNPAWHDVYRVNVATGERELVYENSEFAGFVVDDAFDLRIAVRMEPDGSASWLELDEATGETVLMESIPYEDTQTTSPLGFNRAGDTLYVRDSRQRDTAAVFEVNTKTGERTLRHEDPRADVAGIMADPQTGRLQAVATNYLRVEWTILSPQIKDDFAYLRTVNPGEINVADRTLDDSKWIVAYTDDNGPTAYYLYDRPAKKATWLFTNRPELEGLPLSEMHTAVIPARDGLEMPSYFTLPSWCDADGDARPDDGPLPMVLLVHGGPWARDSWGYNPYHQWLANRGYAVLSPNFRGSTGFGKSFISASDGEWADAMHTDLLDSVNWAVEQGIADPDRVAIMGGSYGGYAALAGLTFSPDFFNCGVSIVGPSNLMTLLESIPPYWAPVVEMFARRVADHRTPEGRRKLRDMSPLTHVDEINKPLLIGQGANDPRVKQRESDQIVHAMQKKDLPVTYVLFPDEGHGFARPENNKAFNAITEVFLAEHLNGRVEPLGDAVAESSAQVLSMGDIELPGVEPTPWTYSEDEPAEAETGPAIDDIAYDDLNDLQKMIVDRFMNELPQLGEDAIPQIIAQIEAQISNVPEMQRPALRHLYHRLKERQADGGTEAGGEGN